MDTACSPRPPAPNSTTGSSGPSGCTLRIAEYTVIPEQASVAAKAGSMFPTGTNMRALGTHTSSPKPPSCRTPMA